MYKTINRDIYKLFLSFEKLWNFFLWLIYIRTHKKINIIIGSGTTNFKGWFATDITTLDITNKENFEKYFSQKKINGILAEHVLEHLTDHELDLMIQNFYDYSSVDVNIRIAVPDGLHKNKSYIDTVKPNGTGEGADDHKHLFNFRSLSKRFEKFGFVAHLKEYWDEENNFNTNYLNDDLGMIRRSFINDQRNADGEPNYTSLIIDFKKE